MTVVFIPPLFYGISRNYGTGRREVQRVMLTEEAIWAFLPGGLRERMEKIGVLIIGCQALPPTCQYVDAYDGAVLD